MSGFEEHMPKFAFAYWIWLLPLQSNTRYHMAKKLSLAMIWKQRLPHPSSESLNGDFVRLDQCVLTLRASAVDISAGLSRSSNPPDLKEDNLADNAATEGSSIVLVQ